MAPETYTHEHVQQMIAYMSSQLSVHPRTQPVTITVSNLDTLLISHVFGKDCLASSFPAQSLSLSFRSSWILNTGATHHVWCNFALFSSLTSVKPIMVTLPNGNTVTVTQNGTVPLSNSLILHDVFHVPSFSLNLISVDSLISHLPCSITFLPTVFNSGVDSGLDNWEG